MDIVLLFKALLLGIVEGVTEFLPVSSTGHLIIAGQLLGFHDEKSNIFEIVIQTGAMLAIVWEYRAKYWDVLTGLTAADDRNSAVGKKLEDGGIYAVRQSRNRSWGFVLNLAIAFMPAAVLGLVFGQKIKAVLFHPLPVALAFIIGGVIILWVERKPRSVHVDNIDDMTMLDALKVGIAQAFALIPGTSRSGATIIGGMLFGLSRRAATEFSFFLAVPTLIAAGGYDLWRNRALFSMADAPLFLVGTVASFVSAFICVRWLLRYIANHDFTLFAWYRIGFGCLVLALGYSGVVTWS
jgi:undecaprenyl-diphosphatase